MYKELGATNFYVATQDIPIEKITRFLDQNSVVTESKKKFREQVAAENRMLRQRPATKTENSIAT